MIGPLPPPVLPFLRPDGRYYGEIVEISDRQTTSSAGDCIENSFAGVIGVWLQREPEELFCHRHRRLWGSARSSQAVVAVKIEDDRLILSLAGFGMCRLVRSKRRP